MAVSATLSNHYKYHLAKKMIDLSSDSIIICPMRQGFVFNPDDYAKKINFKTNSGAISITFAAGGQTITRGTGSFITDGFVIGNKITTDAVLNPGPFTTTNVTQYVITVSGGVVDEGPVTKVVTSDDELITGYGYTQYTKTLTNQVLTEDDANNRAEMTCDDVVWTAGGGTIGPSPGALLVDDTTSDKTVIGYLDFGGDQQAIALQNFTIGGIGVRIV